MTSRVLLALAPVVLLSVAVSTGASCGGISHPIAPVPDGGFGGGGAGGAGSTTTTTTTTTTTSSSSSTGGMTTSSAGTSGTGTGGASPCMNGVKDGKETDVDCGGGMCPGCAAMQVCLVDGDCASTKCTSGLCADTCHNGMKDGSETDIDCGGGACPACVVTQMCAVGTDCQSMSCKGGTCQTANCTDGVKNGTETAIDCGGLICPPCDTGLGCSLNKDCQSKICDTTTNKCKAPSCTDGVQNGTETDIDCGGTGCPACNPGQKCVNTNDCIGGSCATTCQCPAGMLVVPIQGGGIYCIDQNEVTFAQYQTFFNANPPTSSQPNYCSWNLNYTPGGDWPPTLTQGGEPVRFVNWCQADAYCRYNGRRLCGKIGGGHVTQAAYADFTQDQWYNACTSQGNPNNVYPYGPTYQSGLCDGNDPAGAPSSIQVFPGCLGGVPTLVEMSGNVAEWEDGCSGYTGQTETCAVRGGSYASDKASLRCDSGGNKAVTQPRNYQGRDVGFRCCL